MSNPMHWISISRYRGEISILVGFALLMNPFVVGAYDIGDPDWYRYEASEIEFHPNGTFDMSPPATPLDPDVACLGDLWSRSCVLEHAVHANGGITFDGPPQAFINHEYRYVFIWEAGFFRPTAKDVQDGTVRYDLEPVPLDEALDRIATPLSRADTGVRAAIKSGEYETSDELSGAHQLVSDDGQYYVVHARAYHVEPGPERMPAVVALQWVLGFIGAGLVLRGQRQRIEGR